MDLRRFKIIRKAFHPEDRIARACGDKCYQIRHLLRNFKSAAKASFIPGRNISFDDGGIGSRHRLNPVRMYNGSKPQKFIYREVTPYDLFGDLPSMLVSRLQKHSHLEKLQSEKTTVLKIDI